MPPWVVYIRSGTLSDDLHFDDFLKSHVYKLLDLPKDKFPFAKKEALNDYILEAIETQLGVKMYWLERKKKQ